MTELETRTRQTPAMAATELVDELVTALINARIYFCEHPRVKEAVSDLRRSIRALGQQSGTGEVRLSLADSFLVFQERPLVGASLSASRLVNSLSDWGSGGLAVSAAASEHDLLTLLAILDDEPQAGEDYHAANERLESAGAAGIRLLAPFRSTPGSGAAVLEGLGSSLRLPLKMYQSIVDVLQNVTLNVWQGRRIPFEPVHEHAELVLKRLDAGDPDLMGLTGREQYDAFTFGHSVKVTLLALNFGRALTTNREHLLRLGVSALLHDVGKSLVPMEILHSRAALTPEQRDELNRHPELGAQILMDHREADSMSVSVAFGHHKTEANGGYPETIHEHRLSTATRIVKICDTYEALTAARPYKRPMSTVRAYRVMMSMKDHFEPQLLHRFIEINGVYPVGQLVELSTGERAQVIQQSRDLLGPLVRVLHDREGNLLDTTDQDVLDLSSPLLEHRPTILRPVTEETAPPPN
jgi:HD-GYP domain-containing protein (c-di-GMP phosphodiesterase class II)